MLLWNKSTIKHYININLEFDDNTTKSLDIHEGEIVEIKYRRNDCIRTGVGMIKHIKPFIKRSFNCNRQIESAYIVLDMSKNNLACTDKIELFDILDVNFVYPNCCYPEFPPCEQPIDKCNCNKAEETQPPKDDCCQCGHCSCQTEDAPVDEEVINNG
mgnify:CR=1 FL=1